MDSVKIGKYLAELRKSYKVTQDELALRLGVSRQAVSRWETSSSVPDVELLLKMSELYGITIDAILHTDVSALRVRERNPLVDSKLHPKKIFVIGCGRWGTFLAWYLDGIGHKVSLYGMVPKFCTMLDLKKYSAWELEHDGLKGLAGFIKKGELQSKKVDFKLENWYYVKEI